MLLAFHISLAYRAWWHFSLRQGFLTMPSMDAGELIGFEIVAHAIRATPGSPVVGLPVQCAPLLW